MRTPCDSVLPSAANRVKQKAGVQADTEKWILAATILASSMAFIDSTVVNVALPALQANFHATVTGVQWVVEAYGLFLGALILVGGSLGDLFGRRRIFLVGVAIFAVASAGCGAASSLNQLILTRSIQGIGAALLVPGSLAIISNSLDDNRRGKAIGTWSGFTAITTAIGPVLGGWLVQHASWRWVFFLNLPLAAAVMAISLWRIPESHSASSRHLDWLGTLLATLSLGGLVSGFVESVNLGWSNPVVWGCVTAGVGCLLGFVFAEAREASPMVPLSLFLNRSFSGANLLTLFLYSAIGIFFFLFPLNLIQVQGYSSTATGAALLPFIVLMFVLSRWSGGLVARYGPRAPLIIGPIIAALGFALFAVPAMAGNYWKAFFPAIIVLGFGMAVTVAPLTTVVMSSADQDRAGTASGINNAIARVAGVLAIAVFGIVLVYAFRSHLGQTLAKVSLPATALQEIQSHESRLAGLQVPTNLDAATTASVKQLIQEAFIFGFRIVMLICSGLAGLAAAVAGVMIPKPRTRGKPIRRHA
ncbi:MAG: MFS transporter [Acidobacteriales bacterium]|nr:MFS transporter [Terriglobales bacterium]